MSKKAQRRSLSKGRFWTARTTETQNKAARRNERRTGNAPLAQEHCAQHLTQTPGYAYAVRLMIVNSLGYQTYKDYLDSVMWKEIRASVLERDRHRCRMCGSAATQAHHKSYKKEVMLGQKLDLIVSACHSCHKAIERDIDGKKVSLNEANKRLNLLIEAGKVKRAAAAPARKRYVADRVMSKKERARLRYANIHIEQPANKLRREDMQQSYPRVSTGVSQRWRELVKKTISLARG